MKNGKPQISVIGNVTRDILNFAFRYSVIKLIYKTVDFHNLLDYDTPLCLALF